VNNLIKAQAMKKLIDEWAEEIDPKDVQVKEHLLDIDIALRKLEILYMEREMENGTLLNIPVLGPEELKREADEAEAKYLMLKKKLCEQYPHLCSGD
jgi:hypothetical protein